MSKSILLFGLLMMSVISCIDHANDHTSDEVAIFSDSSKLELQIEYAEGFDIVYENQSITIKTKSIDDNDNWEDSLTLFSGENLDFVKTIYPNESLRFACQSSTHLSYLKALGAENNLCGLCGIKYVTDSLLKLTIEQNGVMEICQGEGIMQEAILAAQPDIYLRYPFQSDFNPDDIAINSLYIAEYLEKTPLARLEWIKLFGVLIKREAEAAAYFEEVSIEYNKMKANSQKLAGKFIMNVPYQDDWYMPASNSLVVNLITDAGLTYFYGEDGGTENKLHPKEEVWSDGGIADYWIIIAARPEEFNLNALISEDPAYSTFKAVKEKKVIFCNTAAVPYFTKGVLEPHIMLNDLKLATGQIRDHNPVYFELLQ